MPLAAEARRCEEGLGDDINASGCDVRTWRLRIPGGVLLAVLVEFPLSRLITSTAVVLCSRLFAVLSAYKSRKRYDGEILLLFVLAYAWSTWGLELLRARPHDFTHGLVFTTGLAAVALLAVFERHVRNGRLRPAADRG